MHIANTEPPVKKKDYGPFEKLLTEDRFTLVLTGAELVRLHELSYRAESGSVHPVTESGRFHGQIERILELTPSDLAGAARRLHHGVYKP